MTLVQFAPPRATASHAAMIALHAMTDAASVMKDVDLRTTREVLANSEMTNVDRVVNTLTRVLRHLESAKSPVSG